VNSTLVWTQWAAVRARPRELEVVQSGDAEHGMVGAVAFEAAVAEDLPALHAGQDVLDSGTNSLVRAVVFLFPGREVPSLLTPVRNDQA